VKKLVLVALFLLIAIPAVGQTATYPVISEFATRGLSSASDEYIELYNPTDFPYDLGGWKIEYKAASGTSWANRATIPMGNAIPARGFFLIAPLAYTGTVTADHRAVEWTTGIADDGHIRLVNASNLQIDKVGYGSAIDPEGSAAPNHGTSANTQCVERKANSNSTADSLRAGGVHALLGNGYDTNNNANDFVRQIHGRSPQNLLSPREPSMGDGSGSATATPDTLFMGSTFDLRVTFRRDAQFTIDGLRVIVSPAFQWSRNASDVVVENLSATKSIAGDTITFGQLSFTADSTLITIKSVAAPESTAYYPIVVQTRGTSKYENIMGVPTLVSFGAPVPISEVKTNDPNGVATRMGQLATVHGIVTVANEFGGPSYIIDNSGGMSIFGSAFSTRVQVGDEVIVSGRITQFNGLNQFELPYLHSILGSGNEVTPHLLQVRDIKNEGVGGIELYEGRLVRISGVTVRTVGGNTVGGWAGETNYKIIQNGDTSEARIDKDTNLSGAAAPQGVFDLIGVLGQYKTSSPFIGGYQVMPRSTSDIVASGPIILTTPKESAITPTSVTIGWKTKNPGTTRARHGKTTDYELGHVSASGTNTDHSITITNLSPVTLYYVLPYSVSGVDTSYGSRLFVSTASATSKGTINVYFNKSIDASVARGEIASGNVALMNRFIDRINAAKFSIDLAIYNMSGTTGSTIASALVNAKNRGVKVRVIGEKDNVLDNNTKQVKYPWTILTSNQIPLIHDGFDATNGGNGLMHNKFAVFDYADPGSDTTVWSWTGSWNFSDNGTNVDFQNAIEIQDRALAGAFTLEFNEMWGSATPTPDQSKTRFGARKTDNIPHSFMIGGVPVELYFSPSDRTTEQIVRTVNATNHSANVAMLSFTRSDIANALVARKNAGAKVRVIVDNNTDSGNQFSFLQSNGVNILLDPLPVQLHHKYLIVDAEHGSYPGVVLTGSHNWSTSAETRNDENTLIVRSDRVANLYLQEFKARYSTSGGQDSIIVNVAEGNSETPMHFSLSQNYPNPFNPSTTIEFGVPQAARISLKIYDIVGRELVTLADGEYRSGVYRAIWNARALPSGVYFYRLSAGEFVQQKRMVLVK